MQQDDAIDWTHKSADLRDRRSFQRQADQDECARLSRLFGEADCLSLAASYTIVPLAPGRYRVFGSVTARLGLVCGVTLDPIEQRIAEEFDLEFRPDFQRPGANGPEFDACGALGEVANLNPRGDNFLSVRARPSTSGTELDRLGPGARILICDGTVDGWVGVVYDPNGGFVTGGGWILSPEGAMTTLTTGPVWDQDFSVDASSRFNFPINAACF